MLWLNSSLRPLARRQILYAGNAPYTTRSGELVIASRESGTWVGQKPSGPIVAAGTEDRVWLQIDSAGNPHVAYIEESTRRLIYGVREADQRWDFTAVPTHLPPQEPMVFSLCFALHPGGQNPDLRDTPHMSFEDQSSNSLGYARKVGEVWKVEVVDPEGGEMPFLAYDNLGNAHMAYAAGRGLKYAKAQPE